MVGHNMLKPFTYDWSEDKGATILNTSVIYVCRKIYGLNVTFLY